MSTIRSTGAGWVATALTGALFVAGCGGAQTAPGSGDNLAIEEVDFTVENDLARNRILSIRLISNSGETRLFGTVLPGRTREFSYSAVLLGETYRLLAMDGRSLIRQSREFALPRPSLVEWRVYNNTLVVRPYGDGGEFEEVIEWMPEDTPEEMAGEAGSGDRMEPIG